MPIGKKMVSVKQESLNRAGLLENVSMFESWIANKYKQGLQEYFERI